MKKLVLIFLLLPFGFLLKAQTYGAVVKIKHVLTNTHLHSHAINYGHPQSSGQQQVTGFGGADDNDYWIIKSEHGNNSRSGNIRHGDVIRLEHYLTHRNLHSHASIPSPVTSQQEVTCFGENGTGDSNDNWRIEIDGGGTWSLNTRIRLIHVNTNHALHSHSGFYHPDWTANQQEVTGFGGRDDNDLWTMTEIKSIIKDNTPGSLAVRIFEKDGQASKSPQAITVKIFDSQGHNLMLYSGEFSLDGRIWYKRVPPRVYTIKCSQLFTSGPGANEDAFSNSREVFLSPSEQRITISPGKEMMVEFKKIR